MSITLPQNYRPTDRESFMNPMQQEYFRQKLLKWKGELVEESNQTLQNMQEESLAQPDLADRATAETDRSLELRTRDRFRNEIVIKSEPLSRGLDYEIDYTLGTLIFRKAIPGKDQNLNPIYLVVDYESEDDARDERTTAGGRLALRFADNKAEIGVSGIHEGTRGANADLAGVDVSYQISDKTRLRAEHAGSRREIAGAGNVKGDAYLAEVRHQDANIAATAYVRGQDTSFGLGQQAAAQGGTVKYGGDASYKISEALRANVLAYHERADSAGATADRSVIEGRMNHTTSDYALYGGARAISDADFVIAVGKSGLETVFVAMSARNPDRVASRPQR